MSKLIDELIKEGWLKTPNIIKAFKKVKRRDFLLDDSEELSEINEALPIGFDQTISQPAVVAFMLEKLEPKAGDKILDVGSGSGWTTALLSEIVGSKGKIIGIEIIPQLVKFGIKNAEKYGFVKAGIAKFICGDGSLGYEKEAPFDKILCSASASDKVPKAWKEQLKVKGKIVTPINYSIWLFTKLSENNFEKKEYPGFTFVPLVKK